MAGRLPRIEQLVAFASVAANASFTRAAAELNLTQSAVSQQIRKLEAGLGRRLLLRSAREIALTESGSLLLDGIAGPLRALSTAVDRCRTASPSKRLGVELDSGFAAAWLAPRLNLFRSRFPDIQLEISYSIELVFPRSVHVAVKWGDGRWPRCSVERLMDLNYTPMCTPRLLRGPSGLQVPGDLCRFELIHDRGRQDWADWLTLAELDGIAVEAGPVLNDSNVLLRMLASGEGVGLCAIELAEHSLATGELVAPFRDIVLTSKDSYYVVRRSRGDRDDEAECFARWIVQEVERYLAGSTAGSRPLS